MQDPYQTLDVPRDATAETIKRAHRKRAKATHPDRTGGDEEEFKSISAAYALLSDPEARAHYDRTGQAPKPTPNITSAEDLILTVLHTVILPSGDLEDVLGGIRKALTKKLEKIRQDLAAAREGESLARAELGRYRLREEDSLGDGNLLEPAFQNLVTNAKRVRANLAEALETHEEALRHLDLYVDTRPPEPEGPGYWRYFSPRGGFRSRSTHDSEKGGW